MIGMTVAYEDVIDRCGILPQPVKLRDNSWRKAEQNPPIKE